jgi:hypothetical protein
LAETSGLTTVPRHPDRRALRGLSLRGGGAGQIRQPGHVRRIEDDDARRTGAVADAVEQGRVVRPERLDLVVDVTVRIAGPDAPTQRGRDGVDLVAAAKIVTTVVVRGMNGIS